MRKNIAMIIVVTTMVEGVALRFTGLEKSPPSLGFDEAALGYNAYSLLLTGKDEYGNFLPISLRSFNDFKPALYGYLTVPFIKLFGLNESSVRMVSALAGIVSLWFLYKLLSLFIKDKLVCSLIFLWLSFEPWRLHFSRNAFETHLSSAFFMIGAYYLIKNKKIFWSLLFFGLSAYSYHSARLSVPVLIVLWGVDPLKWFWIDSVKEMLTSIWKGIIKVWWIVGLFIVMVIPVFMANSSLVLTRFNQENVFRRFYPYSPKELVAGNPFLSINSNALYYFGGIISGHVMSYFSPINLNSRIYNWVKMSPQFIPGMGMLGWIEGVVFLFGLVVVIKSIKKSFEHRYLIYWMISGIAPAAVTWTWYHPLRSLNIFPAIEIIVALGAVDILKKIKNKLWYMVIVVILLITVVYTINNELLYSAYENHGEYQPGGFREGMMTLKELSKDYDQVIIDSPHAQSFIFVLFYQQIDPDTVHKYAGMRPKPGVEGNLNFNFEKFVFRPVDWPKDRRLKRTIIWTDDTMSKEEIEVIPGAKLRMVVSNALYDAARIITIE
ncbi:MAG: hypothetical protein ACD_58C00321G0002 [uncultured bacterium]|nr:MAG: hypothetical protein ACD_58C00321G0002 [uncultured bacterium]